MARQGPYATLSLVRSAEFEPSVDETTDVSNHIPWQRKSRLDVGHQYQTSSGCTFRSVAAKTIRSSSMLHPSDGCDVRLESSLY